MNYFRCTVGGSGKGNTVTVTCAEEFAGLTITLSKTGKTYTKTCPSTAPYVVTFYGVENGTYTVSCTVDGQTYSETVVVQDISCVLNYGFTWRTWVDTASQLDSSDYDSLDEVLADEKALRELFLEHACVDYMASAAASNEDLETIINNDYCAKWINLSDYALDYLHANEAIADLMDEADKYGYGEWALMPQVPTMTSNTAPFGVASASSNYNDNPAWMAFTQPQDSYGWYSATNQSTNQYVQYEFVSAENIKRVSVLPVSDSNGRRCKNFKIMASNDNFVDDIHILYEDQMENTTASYTTLSPLIYDFDNNESYKYYRFFIVDGWLTVASPSVALRHLQFYAWAPKGNVPVMTSNTAPYGTASSGATFSADYAAWKAFDGDDSTMAIPCNDGSSGQSATSTLVYKSTNPICVKRLKDFGRGNNKTAILQGSNDGSTWTDLVTYNTEGIHQNYINVPNNTAYYLYYRIYATPTTTSDYVRYSSLQFYGRELKVSVPTMTSNTAPFGEAISNSPTINSTYFYNAFDKKASTRVFQEQNTTHYIGYDFKNKNISIRKFSYYLPNDTSCTYKLMVQNSDDGITWNDYSDEFTYTSSKWSSETAGTKFYDVDGNDTSRYWRIKITASSNFGAHTNSLQFYGLDYSEKEFESGTTKKWLYDHGVELETLSKYKGSATSSELPHTDEDELYILPLAGTSGLNCLGVAGVTLDLTNYSLLRTKYGSRFANVSSESGELVIWKTTGIPSGGSFASGNMDASKVINTITNPNADGVLDISSFNENKFVSVACLNTVGRSASFTELWLE